MSMGLYNISVLVHQMEQQDDAETGGEPVEQQRTDK